MDELGFSANPKTWLSTSYGSHGFIRVTKN